MLAVSLTCDCAVVWSEQRREQTIGRISSVGSAVAEAGGRGVLEVGVSLQQPPMD